MFAKVLVQFSCASFMKMKADYFSQCGQGEVKNTFQVSW